MIMKRLFYFTGYRLTVLHYRRKQLVGSISFEPTEKGLDDFRAYLLQTGDITSKFLVDVIEEDFRKEKIPHVGGKDRKAVVSRLIDRFYRSSQEYCYSEVIGREKSGRKDDVVLIGAITNPQLIQPWISIIDDCEVTLSGIWSLPLVSKKLLKTIKATSGNVLLVSQQVNSNVRQTLFKDGLLIASRQSIVNQDINDISGIGELALPEVNRTIEFMRIQNLVSPNEVINLHILGSDEQIESLRRSFKENEGQTVTIHNIKDILSGFGLNRTDDKFSDGLFSWLCINQGLSASHYGVSKTFNRYYNALVAKALYIASLLALMFGVLSTQSNLTSAMEFEKSIMLIKSEESSYKSLYDEKFKEFEQVFENAGVMNSAVELAERIKINSATSPLDFMIKLSDILSENYDDTLHIDKIEWQAVTFDEINEKFIKANFTDDLPIKHKAIVYGRINESENDYRESVNRIEQIITALNKSDHVDTVEVITMPVDIRSERNFSIESSAATNAASKKEIKGLFSLMIIMKAPDHV